MVLCSMVDDENTSIQYTNHHTLFERLSLPLFKNGAKA